MTVKQRERSKNIGANVCKIRAAVISAKSLDIWRERFWDKVGIGAKGDCWEWRGSIAANGYGSFRLPAPSRDVVGAHRISYFLMHDGIPDGMLVRHKCDNPKCVNPHHLETGDKRDNARDMVSRGRAPVRDQRGEKNGCAKLANSDVLEIRKMVAAGLGNMPIAKKFGVSDGTISNIRRGVSWSSV